MKKYIYNIVALAAMLASCSQDAELNEVIDNQPKAITEVGASTSAETRAVVSTSDTKKVNWETGDQVAVYGEGATGAVAYTLNGTAGSTSGTFKNDASTITAIQAVMYPYQSSVAWDNTAGKLTCEIPTVQTARAGSFDKNAAIMYYIGSETDVTLKHAVAFLKVKIPEGTTNVHAITIYSTTALSGKVDINSTGVAAASTGTETYVTLQADASNGALTAGKDYYIAVLPGTFEKPTIAYKYTNHTAKAKQGSGNLTLAASQVMHISVNLSGAHEAVQLWSGGPYFALFNVGSTITDYASVTATSGQYTTANVGDYFAWGETEPYYSSITYSSTNYNLTMKEGTPPHGNSTDKYTKGYVWETYCGNSSFTEWSPAPYDNNNTLMPDYDAATAKWGNAWRMPTKAELEQLLGINGSANVTSISWLNGSGNQYISGCTLAGAKIEGTGEGYTSNSVFFPAASLISKTINSTTSVYSAYHGTSCWYWSSTLGTINKQAYKMFTNSSQEKKVYDVYNEYGDSYTRESGLPVRAVLK